MRVLLFARTRTIFSNDFFLENFLSFKLEMYDNLLITREKGRERERSPNTEERGKEHAFGEFGTGGVRAIIAVVTNQLHLGSIPQKPTMKRNNLLRNLHLHGTEENCR